MKSNKTHSKQLKTDLLKVDIAFGCYVLFCVALVSLAAAEIMGYLS